MATRKQVVEMFYGKGKQNKTLTAQLLGLTRATVQDHMRNHAADVAIEEEAVRDEPEYKKRNKELEKLVKQQQDRLDKIQKSNIKPPKPVARKTNAGSFIRLIVPDVHGSAVDWQSWYAMLKDAEDLQPQEVVILGDFIDVGGFLSQHHVMGYVAQTSYTFEDDIAVGNDLLNQLQGAVKNSDWYYLYGNHEDRIEKWICTQTLRNPKDSAYLHKLFSVSSLLGLEDRGFNVHYRNIQYDGLPIPGTIKLGHCHFTHGFSTSANAAKSHVEKFAGNVVFGHTHRPDSYSIRTVKDGLVSAWNPGCLCTLQPMWSTPSMTGWGSGYAIQVCQPSGEFLHINVPIINGKSYLMDLTEKLNGKSNTSNKKRVRA